MRDPRTTDGFPLCEAVAELRAGGLLAGGLVAAGPRWERLSPEALAAVRLPGAFRGATIDSRQIGGGELFVALAGARTDGRRFAGAAIAAGAAAVLASVEESGLGPLLTGPVLSGAVALLVTDPRAALARLAAAWRRRLSARVVAVTGTNGKTTTKDLLAALLSAAGPTVATSGNLNNELGVPVSVLGLRREHRYAVFELGASAVGEIARLAALVAPEVGIITNASEAHLAEFGSLAGIIAGKGELLDTLPTSGKAVLNAESPGFEAWRGRARCRVISHGERAGEHRWSWSPAGEAGCGTLQLDGVTWGVPLPGRHNGANLASALLAAQAVDLDPAVLAAGLHRFAGSAHRSRVERVGGLLLFDDCYNANPASMTSAAGALLALPGGGRSIAVLGRMAELGQESEALHRATGVALARLGLDIMVTVGAEAAALADGFAAAGGEAIALADKAAAVAWLAERGATGDRVLIKGSRAAAMEEVIDGYRRLAGRSADGGLPEGAGRPGAQNPVTEQP